MNTTAKYLLVMTLCLFATATSAFSQALDQTPAPVLVVLKVGNLEDASKKIATFAGSLGLLELKPDLADPLTMFLRDGLQATAGVNRRGDMVIAMLDPAAVNFNNSQLGFGLIPISDYQAFIGNYPQAVTDNGISEVHLHAEPQPTFIAHWGDYAAIAQSKDFLLKKPTVFLNVPDLCSKQMNSKDIVVYANFRDMRVKALLGIEKARVEMNKALSAPQSPNPTTRETKMAKLMPLAKIAGNELLDGARRFMLDTDGATWGLNITPDGIATTSLLEFVPHSFMASLAAGAKNTDATLLTGLPDGKYLLFGGYVLDPKQVSDFVNMVTDPLQKEITNLGPDYASCNEFIDLVRKSVAALKADSFGMVAPTGMLGQEPIFQLIHITTGDAKTIVDASHKMVSVQQDVMKTLDLDSVNNSTTTITPNAKTIDGVSFDQSQTVITANPQNPTQQQMMQMMNFIYGPNGLTFFTGIANDQTVISGMGVSDQVLGAAVTAIKTNDDPLGRQAVVKAVAEQLPSKRVATLFFPLDIWANTGLNYAKMFSMDAGVRIPDDLPPVGLTLSTDESSIRCDTFVPAQLLQALTSAGMQFYNASHPSTTQPSEKGGL